MRAANRIVDAAILGLAVLSGFLVALMACALSISVLMRLGWGRSAYGLVDSIELGLMAVAFLAAPWVLLRQAHVSVDILVMSVTGVARDRLRLAANLLGALLALGFCWAAASAAYWAWARGSMIQGVLVLPEWVPLLAPSIGMALMALVFLRRAVLGVEDQRNLTGL